MLDLAPPGTSAFRDHIVGLVRALGPVIRDRAVVHDRDASFPFDNFADFRAAGLLGVCVPREHGGLGATYADYVRVSEEIGRYCGATALTFNMHNATMLWCGQVADLLELSPAERDRHDRIRSAMFAGVVQRGDIHSQPFSEGLAPGATSGVATRAVPVDGGWRVTGRKIFASLSGAASFYNVTCQAPDATEILLLGVPADADGVQIVDDWDPLGMRGTVSRTLLMHDVFVPATNEWMPEGAYNQAALRYPWLFLSLCPSYLGLTGGILDTTAAYLRGELPGQAAGARRDHPIKQQGWAQMQLLHEQSRALLYRAIDTASIDPSERDLVTGWAASATVMEHAAEVASMAIRVCGGQSMMKSLPLERMYRDARLGSTMLPWSAEVCLERLGRARLYDEAGAGMTTGARTALTRAAIVDAAVQLLDAPGDRLTMRRLGDALGADPTAVYRHFRDKSELLRAVGDRLLADVTGHSDQTADWRAAVLTVCLRLREVLLRQPHLAAAVRDAPPLQAGEFAITETLLQQFLRAGLTAEHAAFAYHSVIELTVGSATIDATLDVLDDAKRERRYDRWRQAYATLPADEFPAARSVAEWLYRGTAEDRFTIALDRLLDGIAAHT